MTAALQLSLQKVVAVMLVKSTKPQAHALLRIVVVRLKTAVPAVAVTALPIVANPEPAVLNRNQDIGLNNASSNCQAVTA